LDVLTFFVKTVYISQIALLHHPQILQYNRVKLALKVSDQLKRKR